MGIQNRSLRSEIHSVCSKCRSVHLAKGRFTRIILKQAFMFVLLVKIHCFRQIPNINMEPLGQLFIPQLTKTRYPNEKKTREHTRYHVANVEMVLDMSFLVTVRVVRALVSEYLVTP